MTGYLIVMGWLATIVLGIVAVLVVIVVLITAATRPRKAGLGDDAIAMVRQSRADDKFVAALEAELADLDKRIRGDLGG